MSQKWLRRKGTDAVIPWVDKLADDRKNYEKVPLAFVTEDGELVPELRKGYRKPGTEAAKADGIDRPQGGPVFAPEPAVEPEADADAPAEPEETIGDKVSAVSHKGRLAQTKKSDLIAEAAGFDIILEPEMKHREMVAILLDFYESSTAE